VLEHLHDPAATFRECARLLRPGGLLIAQSPTSAASTRGGQAEDAEHLYLPRGRSGHTESVDLGSRGLAPLISLGAAGGVLRLALVRALGRSTPEFFEIAPPRRSAIVVLLAPRGRA
jgi:SAM-dependent methyltransferase